MSARTPIVEFYWRPGCPFCMMLRLGLRRSRVPIREVNIWADREAAARVRSVAGGNETVPTVVVGQRTLVNPTAKQVLAAVRAEAPELIADEHPRRPRWLRWFGRKPT